MTTLVTEKGKEYALEQLKKRREENAKKEKIDNVSLHTTGSPMYFYHCTACGGLADVKPETYTDSPKKLCDECQALKDLGWLE